MHPTIQEQLNAKHGALVAATVAGADVGAIEAAARVVFDVIFRCCSEGYEVWAYKGSGRILKMGSVGLFRRTSCSYFRGTEKELREEDEALYERCQLLAIERFELHSGL
ncbi:hypothetical protein [Massilia sp. NR 4-1]|uniref:hypothetical protein n=1 Tax=Massilia sp. NR 4-1 TaxID=1678028 RepID=UPI00067E083D|nr:hypothetical protein [Massilia sp. NR 4-1]AKU21237.1 hypothetical protein ACZ75_06840 [Massilia sp. NR 4-1]